LKESDKTKPLNENFGSNFDYKSKINLKLSKKNALELLLSVSKIKKNDDLDSN